MRNFSYNIKRLIVIAMLAWFCVLCITGCVPKLRIPPGVDPVMVSAVIVQANEALLSPGWKDKPAEVLFTLNHGVSDAKLSHLAHLIYELKGTTPNDPDRRLLAQAVTDEKYRPHYFLKVPYSISGSGDVYLAHIMVLRDNLLADYLRSGALLKCNLYLVDGKPHTITHVGEVWE